MKKEELAIRALPKCILLLLPHWTPVHKGMGWGLPMSSRDRMGLASEQAHGVYINKCLQQDLRLSVTLSHSPLSLLIPAAIPGYDKRRASTLSLLSALWLSIEFKADPSQQGRTALVSSQKQRGPQWAGEGKRTLPRSNPASTHASEPCDYVRRLITPGLSFFHCL